MINEESIGLSSDLFGMEIWEIIENLKALKFELIYFYLRGWTEILFY